MLLESHGVSACEVSLSRYTRRNAVGTWRRKTDPHSSSVQIMQTCSLAAQTSTFVKCWSRRALDQHTEYFVIISTCQIVLVSLKKKKKKESNTQALACFVDSDRVTWQLLGSFSFSESLVRATLQRFRGCSRPLIFAFSVDQSSRPIRV